MLLLNVLENIYLGIYGIFYAGALDELLALQRTSL